MPLSRLHRKLVRAPLAPKADLTGRKMIVTGGAPGSIGGETARILALWGADVVLTTRADPAVAVSRVRAAISGCRQPVGVPAAGRVDGHQLDLADPGSVARFAQWYAGSRDGQLDVLVNNAGVHLDLLSKWTEPQRLADGQEIHWRTNYLGSMHLTLLLLPLLLAAGERTGDARVVNVVSKLHARASNENVLGETAHYNSWVAYGASKLALMHATTELSRRYGTAGVQAYSLHPGEVFTDIASKGLAGHRVIGGLRRVLRPVEAFFLMTPAEGAQTSVYAATAPHLSGGQYLRKCGPAEPTADARNGLVAEKLWEKTAEWAATQAAAA
jgi:retinol dehydrogenase-12